MAHTTKEQSISFLSYNLYCLPWLASAFSPSSCPLSSERSTAFLEHIPSYDVIALQEVWDPRYRSLERFARLNNLHVVGSSAPSSFSYLSLRIFGGGLMILSKYPIVDTQEIVFDKGSHSDRFVTKGVLYAKIQVGSSYVHVFNTHLQASYGHEFDFVNNPYATIRQKQLKKLAEFVERVASNDQYPVMLVGDFNVNARTAPDDGSDSKEYADMLKFLHSPSYKVVDILKEHHDGKHPITYGGNGVMHGEKPKVGGQRLDFIFELQKNLPYNSIEYKFSESKVVTFQASGEVFTHISDHYAQTVTMSVDISRGAFVERDGADASGLVHASIALSTA